MGCQNTRGICGCSDEQLVSCLLSRADEMNAGGDNKLGVAIALFKPQVTCAGTVTTPLSSCRYIMDEMYRNLREERFGRPTDRLIDVALPLTLQARKRFLSYMFFFHSYSERTNLFDVRLDSGRKVPGGHRYIRADSEGKVDRGVAGY